MLLDANVLLDLCFIRDGLGIGAISYLRRHDYQLYTTTKCITEARTRIVRLRHPQFVGFVDRACAPLGIQPIDAKQGPIAFDGVNRLDRHVPAAAAHVDAFILTDDAPLLLELDTARVNARTTRELCYESYVPRRPPQHVCISGFNLAEASGHAFFKGIPDDDMLSDVAREWTLWENRRLGRLYYQSPVRHLTFQPAFTAGLARLPIVLEHNTQISVLLNYRIKKGQATNITIKVNVGGARNDFEATYQINKVPRDTLYGSPFRIMNSYQLGNGWKGALQYFTFGPSTIKPDNWKVYKSIIGVSPSTLTMDMMKFALMLTDQRGDYASVPTLDAVMKLAHFTVPDFYHAGRNMNKDKRQTEE